MARKTQVFMVDTEGRDLGKHFLLTEMPAAQAERWAFRAFMAAASHGIDVDDSIVAGGMAGLASNAIVFLSRIPFDEAQPLLDEMMECVQCLPDPKNLKLVRGLVDSDIEEISTRLSLRKAILTLHVNF